MLLKILPAQLLQLLSVVALSNAQYASSTFSQVQVPRCPGNKLPAIDNNGQMVSCLPTVELCPPRHTCTFNGFNFMCCLPSTDPEVLPPGALNSVYTNSRVGGEPNRPAVLPYGTGQPSAPTAKQPEVYASPRQAYAAAAPVVEPAYPVPSDPSTLQAYANLPPSPSASIYDSVATLPGVDIPNTAQCLRALQSDPQTGRLTNCQPNRNDCPTGTVCWYTGFDYNCCPSSNAAVAPPPASSKYGNSAPASASYREPSRPAVPDYNRQAALPALNRAPTYGNPTPAATGYKEPPSRTDYKPSTGSLSPPPSGSAYGNPSPAASPASPSYGNPVPPPASPSYGNPAPPPASPSYGNSAPLPASPSYGNPAPPSPPPSSSGGTYMRFSFNPQQTSQYTGQSAPPSLYPERKPPVLTYSAPRDQAPSSGYPASPSAATEYDIAQPPAIPRTNPSIGAASPPAIPNSYGAAPPALPSSLTYQPAPAPQPTPVKSNSYSGAKPPLADRPAITLPPGTVPPGLYHGASVFIYEAAPGQSTTAPRKPWPIQFIYPQINTGSYVQASSANLTTPKPTTTIPTIRLSFALGEQAPYDSNPPVLSSYGPAAPPKINAGYPSAAQPSNAYAVPPRVNPTNPSIRVPSSRYETAVNAPAQPSNNPQYPFASQPANYVPASPPSPPNLNTGYPSAAQPANDYAAPPSPNPGYPSAPQPSNEYGPSKSPSPPSIPLSNNYPSAHPAIDQNVFVNQPGYGNLNYLDLVPALPVPTTTTRSPGAYQEPRFDPRTSYRSDYSRWMTRYGTRWYK